LLTNAPHVSPLSKTEQAVYFHNSLDAEVIKERIRQLPPLLSQAFFLYQRGYRYQEIADLTNAPLGTVKSRIYFARKRLQEEMTQLGLSLAS